MFIVIIPSVIVTAPTSASNETDKTKTDDHWTELAPMPTPRSELWVAVVDNKIYTIGGTTHGTGGEIVGTNEMYNPINNTWTTKTSMPTPRSNFGIAVYQNKIILFRRGHRKRSL